MKRAEADQIAYYLDLQTARPQCADLAFIFGTRFAEPAHLAVDLVSAGTVRWIVLTGGRDMPGSGSEAQRHWRILAQHGVPQECVVLEEASTNTLENVLFALPRVAVLSRLDDIHSMVAVTKWYHARRAVMTLKRHLPDGVCYYVASYEPPPISRRDWWRHEESRKRVLKEWRNIPRYFAQGDLAEIRYHSGAYL